MTQPEIVEGELLPDVIDHPPPAPGLFGTDDPNLVIARAVEISDVLKRVLHDKKLYASISGKEHVLVEGWALLGSLLGVFPVTVWTRKLEDGWEARVEARTLDGRIVGAAESECLRAERKWANADDYAVRSMAQTRATSKALRQPLGFVMHLAGFETTPAEEIPADRSPKIEESGTAAGPTGQQMDQVRALLDSLAKIDPATDRRARCREIVGVPKQQMTVAVADVLIRQLQGALTELLDDRGTS
jgi:hypothetical protein